jgi:hypothetical protein
MGQYKAWNEANKNLPTVGFRCPSIEVKEKIKQVASSRGQSVGEYLQSVVLPQLEKDVERLKG